MIILSDKVITDQDVYAYASPEGRQEPIGNGGEYFSFKDFNSIDGFTEHAAGRLVKHYLEQNAWDATKTAAQLSSTEKEIQTIIKSQGLTSN